MRTARNFRAFSLVELLCVMGIISVAAGTLGGTSWHVLSARQLRNCASEFVQSAKTARRYAIDHHCRTRLVFQGGIVQDDSAENPGEEKSSYRIHAFIVPSSAPGDAGRWVPVGGARGGSAVSARTEWARVEQSPRSESLVGRWLACEGDPKVKTVPEAVKITSPLLTRFREDPREAFFAENFYSPETVWAPNETSPYEPENCLSFYPANYRRTPGGASPKLLSGPLPGDEMCLDPMTGQTVAASTFWPGTVRFIRGMNPGETEELPGLEFQPDGALACTWTREIEVRFAHVDRPHSAYLVVVDAATGLARLVDAEAK